MPLVNAGDSRPSLRVRLLSVASLPGVCAEAGGRSASIARAASRMRAAPAAGTGCHLTPAPRQSRVDESGDNPVLPSRRVHRIPRADPSLAAMGKAFVVNELAETWLLSILLVAQQAVNAGLCRSDRPRGAVASTSQRRLPHGPDTPGRGVTFVARAVLGGTLGGRRRIPGVPSRWLIRVAPPTLPTAPRRCEGGCRRYGSHRFCRFSDTLKTDGDKFVTSVQDWASSHDRSRPAVGAHCY